MMSNGTEQTTDSQAAHPDLARTGTLTDNGSARDTESSELAEEEDASPGDTSTEAGAEDLESLRTKAAKADENWGLYLRAVADLENYRKRATREKQEAVRFANESLFSKLLPVLDSFEGALAAAANGEETDHAPLREGVDMIQSQLRNALAQAGLEEIDASGAEFDPNFHEAVAQHDSDEVPDGHVLQQIRKGYKYRERLLRPASVVVARGTARA